MALRRGTFSNFLSLTGAELFARVVGLALVPFLARTLDRTAWTAYEGALGAYLIALSAVRGFEMLTMRRAARSPNRLGAVTGTALTVGLVYALPAAALMAAWAATAEPEVMPPTLLFALGLLVVPFGFRFALIARHRGEVITVGTVLGQLVFAGLVFLFVREPAHLERAAFFFVLGVVGVTEAVTLVAHLRWFEGPRRPDRRLLRAWFATSVPVVGGRFLRNAMFSADMVLLVAVVGLAGAEAYTGAYKLAQVVMPLVLMLHAAGFAGFTRAVGEGRQATAALVRRYGEVTLGALVPFALCVTAVAGPLLSVVLGDGYAEGAPLLALLVWKLPLIALNTSLRCVLWVRAPRRDLALAALGLGCQVVAFFALLAAGVDPLFGAALATVGGEAALLSGLVVWARGAGYAGWLPRGPFRRRLVAAAALPAGTFLLPDGTGPVTAVVVAVAAGGVALLVATEGHLLDQWRRLTGRDADVATPSRYP